jgi:hypothetical protein
MAPARICSTSAAASRLCLPEADVHRQRLRASNIRCRFSGVQVVARVPPAGPVPPPIIVASHRCERFHACCGLMKGCARRCRRPSGCGLADDFRPRADASRRRYRPGCQDCRPLPIAEMHGVAHATSRCAGVH